MSTEQAIAQHYGRTGIEEAILDALRASGKDVERLVAADLSGADEFHLGWRAATAALAADLGLDEGMHVLDIGAGIGGPARYFAQAHGCRISGIDLTAEFVAVANSLTRRCGLADRVSFVEASALALPFEPAAFDAATLIHVGMNIADKPAMFAEVRRALKPDGRFGVYDVMAVGTEPIPYPVPWAQSPQTSFVETPATYRRLLGEAGFAVESETNRADLAVRLGREMRDRSEKHGPPPLGLHLIMGPATPERLGNIMKAVQTGIVAPIAMVARRRG